MCKKPVDLIPLTTISFAISGEDKKRMGFCNYDSTQQVIYEQQIPAIDVPLQYPLQSFFLMSEK
jgi:hypothetical protein